MIQSQLDLLTDSSATSHAVVDPCTHTHILSLPLPSLSSVSLYKIYIKAHNKSLVVLHLCSLYQIYILKHTTITQLCHIRVSCTRYIILLSIKMIKVDPTIIHLKTKFTTTSKFYKIYLLILQQLQNKS